MNSLFSIETPSYFINPRFIPAQGLVNTVRDPANGNTVGVFAESRPEEIDAVLTSATAAQRDWKQLDAKSRAKTLHALANAIETADLRYCAELMTREMGKPYPEAIGELANCAPIFRYYAELARDDAGKVAGTTQTGSFQYARYEPLGVSVHIMPFNFPILLMCWTVAASLASGNGCIIKPAPATTLCTLEFMRCFTNLPANFPNGLVNCLPGGAAVAEALIASERTHAVAFTGSVAAAKAVAAAAATLMKPAVIEAGGSDPMIISSHAPIDIAAAGATTAAFHMSGQVCTSTERIYVVDSVFDAFVAAFVNCTLKLRIGHGLQRSEIGPLVSEAARNKVMRLVDAAVAQGAVIVTGGRIPPSQERGWFYEPTILINVTHDMDIMREECFGPVASICRVADFNEAITLANDSAFGLGASIFTTSLEEAMEAAERIEAGMVWINNPLIDNDALPFGGWKLSGLGRELSRQGLDAFRRSKMVILNHKPALQDWWYPYPDSWFHDAGGRTHN
ncbi:aldehyde dehydrogenase family protein [Solimicrobium silvestre]|nr:aldehyde dehydrogenase family protein [Solimicrobium silvestre]